MVRSQIPRIQVDINLAHFFVFDGPVHDSGCQVGHIAQNRKLLPAPTGSHDTNEHLAGRDADIARGPVNFLELSPYVEGCQDSPRRVIVVRHRGKAPQANQCAALVIHDELVERALVSVNLLLDTHEYFLNFLHAGSGLRRRKLNSQRGKHDG